MQKTITLLKMPSGFSNVPDKWDFPENVLERDDFRGDCEEVFYLPDGLCVKETILGQTAIYDERGGHCPIVAHSSGMPQLVVRPDYMPVLKPMRDE